MLELLELFGFGWGTFVDSVEVLDIIPELKKERKKEGFRQPERLL